MCILGGGDGALPRVIRAYVNQEALDFSDAEGITPEQEFEITDAPDPEGTREYPMLFSRFQVILFLHPDTRFSHMSHTPFPHISEFNSLFTSDPRPRRLHARALRAQAARARAAATEEDELCPVRRFAFLAVGPARAFFLFARV